MAYNFKQNFDNLRGRVRPSKSNLRTDKRVISKFTQKMGFVYFGSVNQHYDDHRIVRGFSVSSTHNDNHYSVGSIDGYDVTLVDRSDTTKDIDGKKISYNLMIVEIDLHTVKDIPHIFISAKNHDPKPYINLFRTFPALKEVEMGTFESYGPEFTSRYEIYAKPTQAIEVERLFPATSARVIGAHFWPFSAEIHERTVYMYADNERVTLNMLNALIENGVWLAKHLDLQAELV
ncbi:MAG TPA: hypothetical protein PLZ58_02860 [Candidatus Saccharibacteria bacterium]|nr:hypothetical protein [Candidatus Saccharibacteria bacterium]HRQ06712.1 hypothetical protein [Candidatus Saccharibacteria bacterium]